MKKNLFIIALTASTVFIFSCQKNPVDPSVKSSQVISTGDDPVLGRVTPGGECEPTEVTLVAGQTINSGTVKVTNDNDFIYVTYTTVNGWLLTQTHLYVGNCAAIPVNNQGNPVPGQFPYGNNHNYITSYTYQVPISAIGAGNCACVAAHAVVVKLNAAGQVVEQQTGWGNGTRINPNSGNWGMKFEYCTCIPE